MLTEEKKLEIMEILSVSPLLLLNDIQNEEVLEFCNSVLPFSVGVEIEAEGKNLYGANIKVEKLYLMSFSHSDSEQRFRIPKGYKGLIALELITNQLKHILENTLSGNHYHIDCSDNFSRISEVIMESDILTELDSWGYEGTYNKRDVGECKGRWVALRSGFKTCEIRIGELAYDYATIYKRITSISKYIYNLRIANDIAVNTDFDNEISILEIRESLIKANELIKDITTRRTNKLQEEYKKIKEVKKVVLKPLNKDERVIKCY